MVGPALDCFSNPLGAVRMMFEKGLSDAGIGASEELPSELCRADWGVPNLFRSCILDTRVLHQVPEVNSVPLESIPPNSLVRFRGMIQDMLNVEYYVGAFKDGQTWRTNKFTDVSSVPFDNESEMQLWDRRPLYCVPVPGENAWVKAAFATPQRIQSPTVEVRRSEKRTREEDLATSEAVEMEEDVVNMDHEPSSNKRACANGSTSSGNSQSALQGVRFGEENLLSSCLVKVYDGADTDLKLNEVVEFVGVLTFDPELSATSFRPADGSDNLDSLLLEDVASQMPSSKVPRLHCIFYQKLTGHKLISAIPTLESKDVTPSGMKELRQSLLQGLTGVLGGDALAAEYLLLHLLSQVHARVEPMAVGKLSLNLSNISASSDGSVAPVATIIDQTISNLLPRSCLLPITLELMNAAPMAPKKNYTSNRLVTGALQIADGTHLTIDETVLKSGHLNEVGVQNIHILKNLMEWQKVEYDFEYYQMEMAADVPVLVLSSAKSRLFPADVVLPVRFTAAPTPLHSGDSSFFQWQLFISTAKKAEHVIDLSVQKVLEDDLVAARQEDRSLGAEVFHRWLTLARLMSLSMGETTLSLEHWQMVREMERKCSERLRCS